MGQEHGDRPKTGEFRARAEVGLELEDLDEAKTYQRRYLLDGMARQVSRATEDNRRYELVAQVGLWEPGDWPDSERLQVDFTLVLLDPLTADVGEWVKDLPVQVPHTVRWCKLGPRFGEASGWLFQKGRPGWQRIE